MSDNWFKMLCYFIFMLGIINELIFKCDALVFFLGILSMVMLVSFVVIEMDWLLKFLKKNHEKSDFFYDLVILRKSCVLMDIWNANFMKL